jgi:acyl transferase domain-containing protein
MLGDLALCSDRVRQVLEAADSLLAGALPQALSSVIFPPPAYSPEEEDQQNKKVSETWFAQPALGAANYAMFSLLKDLGISPEFVAGHSYGEYTALCAAGAIGFPEMIRLSERRGRAVQETQGTNDVEMVAVQAGADELRKLINGTGVSIAGANAPDQTIVGGRREAIAKFTPRLDAASLGYKKLAMSAGFHIPEAKPAADRFAESLDRVEFREPKVPVFSNLEAAPYPGGAPATRKILLDQLTHPLRFQEEIEAMYAAGARVFVEVGPGQVLTGLVQRILQQEGFTKLVGRSSEGCGLVLRLGCVCTAGPFVCRLRPSSARSQ